MNTFAKEYFQRIGLEYDTKEPLTGELLKKIQYAHVTTVPYENIDILNKVPITMDTDRLFEKVVVQKKGGYCFELNGLLARLLRELGFEVKDYMGRFLRAETTVPMRRHRVLLVKGEDGLEYICDVGVGSLAPRYPIPFVFGKKFEQFGEYYCLRKDEFYGNVLEELYKGEWRDVFGFTFEPQLDIDYVMPSFYCEKHPDSIFNKGLMISLKNEKGRKTLDKNIYKEFTGGEITLIKELNEAEVEACLKEVFNLHY